MRAKKAMIWANKAYFIKGTNKASIGKPKSKVECRVSDTSLFIGHSAWNIDKFQENDEKFNFTLILDDLKLELEGRWKK